MYIVFVVTKDTPLTYLDLKRLCIHCHFKVWITEGQNFLFQWVSGRHDVKRKFLRDDRQRHAYKIILQINISYHINTSHLIYQWISMMRLLKKSRNNSCIICSDHLSREGELTWWNQQQQHKPDAIHSQSMLISIGSVSISPHQG